MKKHITGLFGLTLLLAAASAQAQITTTVRVTVPFPFVTAGQTMPAADYNVQITRDSGVVIGVSERRAGWRRSPRRGIVIEDGEP
jgi:hypothetical protein